MVSLQRLCSGKIRIALFSRREVKRYFSTNRRLGNGVLEGISATELFLM